MSAVNNSWPGQHSIIFYVHPRSAFSQGQHSMSLPCQHSAEPLGDNGTSIPEPFFNKNKIPFRALFELLQYLGDFRKFHLRSPKYKILGFFCDAQKIL
jgi:hypothetical protein